MIFKLKADNVEMTLGDNTSFKAKEYEVSIDLEALVETMLELRGAGLQPPVEPQPEPELDAFELRRRASEMLHKAKHLGEGNGEG